MPVPVETIKARLRVLFPKANLSQKRLDVLAAKLATKPEDGADDNAVDLIINQSNDFYSFEEIAKDDDRMRTLEANQKAPANPEPPKPTDPPATPPINEAPEWAKALIEKVTNLETGKVTDTKKQTVKDLVSKSAILSKMKPEVRERWENRIDVNSETSFEDQLKELETEYSEIVQTNANDSNYAGAAGGGSSDIKPSEAEIKSIVDNLKI